MSENKTPYSNAIRFEMLSFEKRNGEKPKFLVLGFQCAEKVWAETYDFISRTEGAKFENPINGIRQFLGVNVIVLRETHGGSFNFGFGD